MAHRSLLPPPSPNSGSALAASHSSAQGGQGAVAEAQARAARPAAAVNVLEELRKAVMLPLHQYDPVRHACWRAGEPTPYLHVALTLQVGVCACVGGAGTSGSCCIPSPCTFGQAALCMAWAILHVACFPAYVPHSRAIVSDLGSFVAMPLVCRLCNTLCILPAQPVGQPVVRQWRCLSASSMCPPPPCPCCMSLLLAQAIDGTTKRLQIMDALTNSFR